MSKDYSENPYKKEEFEAFLKAIKKGSHAHWIQIAEALGVDKDTITNWKNHPKAQKAIQEGINHALEQMERSGSRDWRMWQEKLKLLGVQSVDKQDITSDGERIQGPVIYRPGKEDDE